MRNKERDLSSAEQAKLGLPGWVVSNRQSVLREVAPYRALTPQQRFNLMAEACRAAAAILDSREDRAKVLSYQDPLPESTLIALRKLRAAYSGRA